MTITLALMIISLVLVLQYIVLYFTHGNGYWLIFSLLNTKINNIFHAEQLSIYFTSFIILMLDIGIIFFTNKLVYFQ